MFDATSFMNTPSAPMDTVFEVIPEGEFKMMVDSDPAQIQPAAQGSSIGIVERSGTSERTGKPYHIISMNLNCIVMDDNVRKTLGREVVKCRAQINLDIDGGKLSSEKGKNVTLGQLRAALDQNTPDWTPAKLLGAGPFIGRVKQRAGKDDRKYSEVVAFAKIT